MEILSITNARLIIEIFFFFLLLLSSALISGSEVAFFSLLPQDIEQFKKSAAHNKISFIIIKLLKAPDKLLATILISNNFVNIGIVILSTFIINELFYFPVEWQRFLFEVVIVTFLILLFGEVIPKVYANTYNKTFAQLMAYPLYILNKILSPVSSFLLGSSAVISKIVKPKDKFSLEDISKAIDITSGVHEEKKIIKEIIRFGSVDVKEIMTPRVDVVAIDYDMKFSEVKQKIAQSGFSRYPVFKERLDNIVGILVAKDLIAHLHKDDSFNWQALIRKPLFVPETMKIDDLFELFQQKKTHLAIVIDEYGGFSGIVTLEDVLEEIVGDITDEHDKTASGYKKLPDGSYEFDGKFLINDFYRVFNINEEIFDQLKGDAETLAGLLLEIKGDFPKKGEKFVIKGFEFQVLDVDKRHILKIKVRKV